MSYLPLSVLSANVPGTEIVNSFTNTGTDRVAVTALTQYVFTATEDCYFDTGDGTEVAAATDHYLPAGVPRRVTIPSGHTSVAAIRVSVNGDLHLEPVTTG